MRSQRRRHDDAHEPRVAAARPRAAVRTLQHGTSRSRFPSGVSYSAGDHLGIVPRNGLEAISAGADTVQARPKPLCDDLAARQRCRHAPAGRTSRSRCSAYSATVLSSRTSRRAGRSRPWPQHAKDEKERQALEALAGDGASYGRRVFASRKSVLDVLDEYPSYRPAFRGLSRYDAAAEKNTLVFDLLIAARRRYYMQYHRPGCWRARRSAKSAARSGRSLLQLSRRAAGRDPRCMRSSASQRSPSILGEPPPADDHDRAGHGRRRRSVASCSSARRLKKQGLPPISESLLFFGYAVIPRRTSFTRTEMRAFEAGVIVTKLVCVFSREPGEAEDICAAGDRGERRRRVWELLQKDAAPVFVCGEGFAHGARRQAGFRRPFLQAHWRLCRGWQGVALTGLVTSHRYLEDIWASAAPVGPPS